MLACRPAKRGEGRQPRRHRDHHGDRQDLSQVGRRSERDQAERHRHPAQRQGQRRRDPGRAQRPADEPPRLARQPQHDPGEAGRGEHRRHAERDHERQPVHVGDRGNPDQDQRDQREHVDRPGHRAQQHHVDVPAVDALLRGGTGGADEVPDRAGRVVPPEPDPAELVHRAAMRRVQRQGLFLVLAGGGQVAARQAHLAGQEVHVGLVRGQRAGPGRGLGRDVEALSGQRGLRHAHVRLPVAGREAARLVRRPQRVRVVAPVDQGVAGQPVRPLVGRVERHRPVGRADRLGVAFRAQVRAGHQAPGPAALRFGRDHPGQQRGGLVETPDVEHRRSPRQLLPQLDHSSPITVARSQCPDHSVRSLARAQMSRRLRR